MWSIFSKPLSSHWMIIIVSLGWTLLYNQAFFWQLLQVYPFSLNHFSFLVSIACLLFAANLLLLTVLNFPYVLKTVIVLLMPLAALAGYFMQSYHVIIDKEMMENIFSTNVNESLDLLSLKLVIYFLLLGVLPSWLMLRSKIVFLTFRRQCWVNFKILLVIMAVFIVQIVLFSKADSSFVREHKYIRYYANPLTLIYSTFKYINKKSLISTETIVSIGQDGKIHEQDSVRELIILVVGETARADHFSLNGYSKSTNPLLKKEQVYSYRNFTSCGTTTAISVPCMFSVYPREDFKDKHGTNTENLLDVLSHAGINILWRDNNSSSKGVALRVPYEDFRSSETNSVCDDECRDEGMLVGLQDYIDSHKESDILIVLHQMGNHGPAYYKRYPKAFEYFTPVCKTNELQKCTNGEISNAYDNAILYTDYFLSKVIDLLKQNDTQFETAMFYMSDHGESLGENNLYLHGLPYLFAPDSQKHVPAIMWFGQEFIKDLDRNKLRSTIEQHYSHDHLFHTVLGLFEVATSVYNSDLDILATSRMEN